MFANAFSEENLLSDERHSAGCLASVSDLTKKNLLAVEK
jgi:hypothetical protein